jgi:hypothetical protein
MGLGLAHDLCSKLHLAGCFEEVFGRELVMPQFEKAELKPLYM